MNEQVMELISRGGTLITANNRLAHYLRYRYAQAQIHAGASAWETPDILPWPAWLQRHWEICSFNRAGKLLLEPVQELALWQQIISRSRYADRLLQPSTVARRAAEAWSLVRQYQLALFPSDVFVGEDAFAFKTWAGEFENECGGRGWLDNASLPDALMQYINERAGAFEQNIALLGFEALTPQQAALFQALAAAGAVIHTVPAAERNASLDIRGCADAGAEITAAAIWARDCLENNPEASIGVVVPNLNALRGKILSRFEDVLFPGALVNAKETGKRPFSLSLGRPLSAYPLIDVIFALLALGDEPVALTDLSVLLRTPFIPGAEEEKLQRAVLDSKLRSHGETGLDLKTVFYIAGVSMAQAERPAQFLQLLKQAQAFRENLPGKQTPGQWAKHFSELLKICGWPGGRRPDSNEYQCIQTWQKALARFASLQMVTPVMGYTTAASQLNRIAGELHFQPESEETPIQILGMEGSAGMGFEYLWIMGLHEENWPPPAQPNPFIPVALQKRFQLPGASADAALAQAQRLLTGLVNSATRVVLSFPQNENERLLRPSPLLKGLAKITDVSDKRETPDYLEQIFSSRELESFTDEKAPPLNAGEVSSGGAALFRDHAACHFRAFARHRLHAETLDQADIGLDARERGSLLHRVMQELWLKLASLENLLSQDDKQLEAIIAAVVDETLKVQQRKHPRVFTERFTLLEVARLKCILRDWLRIERERAPFTVLATEQAQTITFAGLQIQTRVDRIDELEDGGRIIIDYKTGDAGVKEWAGRRPDDPQLPLYAVAHDKDIAALAFARLKRGDGFGYEGLAGREGLLPGVQAFPETRFAKQLADSDNPHPGWADLLADWETTLKELATGFREGDARVNPRDANACLYCDQHTLCRIHELTYLTATENEN